MDYTETESRSVQTLLVSVNNGLLHGVLRFFVKLHHRLFVVSGLSGPGPKKADYKRSEVK